MNQVLNIQNGQGILKDYYKGGIQDQQSNDTAMLEAIRRRRKGK